MIDFDDPTDGTGVAVGCGPDREVAFRGREALPAIVVQSPTSHIQSEIR